MNQTLLEEVKDLLFIMTVDELRETISYAVEQLVAAARMDEAEEAELVIDGLRAELAPLKAMKDRPEL